MQNPRPNARQTLFSLMVAALCVLPEALRAEDDGVRVLDEPSARRVVVLLGSSTGQGDRDGVGPRRQAAVPIAHAALVYRFSAVVVDATGEPVDIAGAWTAILLGDGQAVVQLGSARATIEIPRPYGLQLNAGDTLRILAELPTGATVQITMEYESAADRDSRLPVTAASTSVIPASASGPASSFTWTSERSGRLVALVGASLTRAAALELVDETTGLVIWRSQASLAFGSTDAQGTDIVRLGVRLTAGHRYRLEVTHLDAVPPNAAIAAPVAMLVPAR